MARTSEEYWEDKDQPDIGALRPMDAGQSKDGNLRARVEAQAEEDSQREHLPRTVHNPEDLLEDAGQESLALELQVLRSIVF